MRGFGQGLGRLGKGLGLALLLAVPAALPAGAVFAEVQAKFGATPQWHNPAGMAAQLSCHIEIARHKAEWNLEPDRRADSPEQTRKEDCNPPFV